MRIGSIPELLIISFFVLLVYGIPIAAVVWIILTLKHIRSDVVNMKGELEELKRLLLSRN